jgi:hypothetical protein
MQFSQAAYNFLSLRPKYLPQHPLPDEPQCDTKFQVHMKQQDKLRFLILVFTFSDITGRTQNSKLKGSKQMPKLICT